MVESLFMEKIISRLKKYKQELEEKRKRGKWEEFVFLIKRRNLFYKRHKAEIDDYSWIGFWDKL